MIQAGVVILMRLLAKLWLRLHHRQKGFTLIETLLAVAIFAAIGIAAMNGLFIGYKSLDVCQERTFAESLAKSQVEYIKDQNYIPLIHYEPGVLEYQVIDIPADLESAGYTVEISPPETVEPAGVSGYELQGITIIVKRNGDIKLTVIFYRTGLAL
ncbi:prepilin-type N-terminal cleavage/methylation domain-containing protein [Chloroflexota bacterium]